MKNKGEVRNRLIIVGNGFDLAHGLKTSYKDFINWLLCDAYSKFIKNNFYFSDEVFEFDQYNSYLKTTGYDAEFIVSVINNYPNNFKINNKLIYYLIKQYFSENNWADIETAYFIRLLSQFKNAEIKDFPFSKIFELKKIKQSVTELNQEINYLTQRLNEYLKKENLNLCKEMKMQQHRASLLSDITEPNNDDSKLMYLNFNYTSTLTVKGIANENEVNFINGRIDDETNPIIFGYGDENSIEIQQLERLNHKEFLEKLKSFQYLKNGNYKRLLAFIDSQPFDTYILGHSCGISDRALLKEIFENENCKTIGIFYYNNQEKDNYDDLTINISRQFSDKIKMRRKIIDKNPAYIIPQVITRE